MYPDAMHVTRGLLEYLLEVAAEHEPEAFEADLGVTRAGEFEDGLELPPETPIFTHFYLPSTGASVSAVFGLDLGTGPGQTQGRFISHPEGDLGVRATDELHEAMLVAIPPWDREAVRAFDRAGKRVELTVVDAEPPDVELVDEEEL